MKILLLSLSGIGNFIMQSPVFAAIKKAHPDWHITVWVAPRGTKQLAEANQHIDRVIEASIKGSPRYHLKMARRLARARYDIGIVLSPGQLIKSAAYLFFAGIPRRIGHAYPRKGKQSARFFTDAITESESLHDIEQNLNLLQPLKIPTNKNTPYSLHIPARAQKNADHFMQQHNMFDSRKLLGLHPGSAPDFLWKRWPAENFAKLARHFTQKNYHVLIFGGPDEGKLKAALKDMIGTDATTVEADLLTTAAVAKKCGLFVSNDSGLMHIAAAVGAATYGLFGPTDELKTGPRGTDSRVIRPLGTVPVYDTEQNYHLGNRPHESLLLLSVDQVVSEIVV